MFMNHQMNGVQDKSTQSNQANVKVKVNLSFEKVLKIPF